MANKMKKAVLSEKQRATYQRMYDAVYAEKILVFKANHILWTKALLKKLGKEAFFQALAIADIRNGGFGRPSLNEIKTNEKGEITSISRVANVMGGV